MTAPQATDLAAWLDRLEKTHHAATPGRNEYPSCPWLEQNPDEPQEIEAVWSDGGRMVIGECFEEATVTAIVAEHNAFGELLRLARERDAVVRAVLELIDPETGMAVDQQGGDRLFAERDIRSAVTAALGATGGER